MKRERSRRFKDILHQQFNDLLVLSFSHHDEFGSAVWLCRCKCGSETVKRMYDLVAGRSKTCGCGRSGGVPKNDPRRKHGMGNEKIYGVWVGMMDRCNRPNN